jgi:two-component system, cell cycle sensor histidine kinase and response regulator CckA
MHDPSKTNQELIEENALLKQRIQELEIAQLECKQENDSLRESEEKYRILLSELPDPSFSFTPKGQYKYVNKAFAEGVGKPVEDIIGKSIWDIFPKEEADKRFASLSQVFNAGKEKVIEVRVPRTDGDRYYMTTITPIKDMNEEMLSAFCSSKDITDRKRMEEALRESEEKYRILFENAGEGIFVIQDGNLVFLNPVTSQIIGYSCEELLGRSFIDFICPDDRDWVTGNYLRRIKGEDFQSRYTFRCLSRNGAIRWIEIGAVLIEWAGRPATLNFSTDITDRKQAEQALRESEERYRSIIENIEDGYFEVDMSGSLIFFNEPLRRIFDYPREELLGMNNRQYTTPETAKRVFKTFNEMYRTNISVKILDYEIARKDGSIRHLEVSSSLIRDNSGTAIGCRGIARDVTERYNREEEKEKLKEQLQKAQKMEAIGTLAGGIAHDFNNLLMGIQGNSSLMLMNLDPSHPNYERLKRIEDQVQSGADLTRQLLGFASEGRYEVKPTDMNDVLEKTSSIFERTKKEISIHRKTGKDLWSVEVDRGQMEQVFMNLYVNAWRAMPTGGEIYIETENVFLDENQALSDAVKPGRYIMISITDTGTGMDEKTRNRIFDPFFTTKAMGRGTGLGLAAVYGIIKGHGGTINVDSKPDHGTTFNIYLPASKKGVANETVVNGEIVRGMETILLVDDEKVVLEVNKELLEFMGYMVYAAESGQEAIAVFMEKRTEIDLVILDMIMPGISGGDTFDKLRKINPEIKVLLSSGYSLTGQAQEIMNRGCNGFLQKPFHIEKLSSTVRKMLS